MLFQSSFSYLEVRYVKLSRSAEKLHQLSEEKRGHNQSWTVQLFESYYVLFSKSNKKLLYLSVSELRENFSYSINLTTMCKYIYRCRFRNYVAVPKPYSSPRLIVARKRWANMDQNWDMGQWSKAAFSDEWSFTVKPTSILKCVWMRQGERYRTVNSVPTFKSGFGSIFVWVVFYQKVCPRLVCIEENLKQTVYIKILEDKLLPFQKIIMEANTTWYFNKVAVFLIERRQYHLLWKQNDFCCFHGLLKVLIWTPLKMHGLYRNASFAAVLRILLRKMRHKWAISNMDSLPSSYFEKLNASMSRRVKEVQVAKGLSTKY